MDFIIDSLLNLLARIEQILADAPRLLYSRLKLHLDSFSTTTVAGGIGTIVVWTVGFAEVIPDWISSIMQQLARAPVLAIVDEARKRVSLPGEWKSHVIRADQAALMAVDIVAVGASQASNLSLGSLHRVWSRLDALKSRLDTVVNGFAPLRFARKLVGKLWSAAVQAAIVLWNYASAGVALVIIASFLDRIDRGLLESYWLQQRNPLVKDTRLGRRRVARRS